ncbi:MAG TPA: GGDEF domain-containing protein [Roseomonas sp.]|jgi:diguanylate cyclase (GGDEF)-like protein
MRDAADHDEARDAEEALLRTRIESVLASMPLGALFGWLGTAVVAAAFWQNGRQTGLMLWLAVLGAVNLTRAAAALAFRHGLPRHWAPARWAVAVSVLNGLVGIIGGIGCLWLVGLGEDRLVTLLCCYVMAIAIGSFASLAYWPAHTAMHVPIFTLLAVGFLGLDQPGSLYLALGTTLLCIFVAGIGRSLGRNVVLAMRLSIENQLLADRLRGHAEALTQANDELTELSATDPLTGLANRRRLDAMLDVEWQRGLNAGRSIGLIIVDIDHFKAYNDRHGHTAGDDCLQLIAAVLRRHIRYGVDLPARYGGAEFAVLLPDADQATAAAMAEHIRTSVAALNTAVPGVLRKVTVSIGIVATAPQLRWKARDFVAAADRALYEAKCTGRDRVQTAKVAV